METREQVGAAKLVDAGSRKRLLSGDSEVEMARWKKSHNKVCHPGSVKKYRKTRFLLIGPDTTFIMKGSVFAYRALHYI